MSTTDTHTLVKIFAGLPRTTRGRSINIHIHPKGTKLLYCNGNSVFIRDIENPTDCDVYTQHAKDTTCASYAPSGFYIASGDIAGKIRIWDTVNKEHILKYEYQSLSGKINDIAWTEDSKRIAVCGEGREKYAYVFMWDTGTSVGKLDAPLKHCNSVDIKQTRPYRLVIASEDYSSCIFEGPPFKLSKQHNGDHINFVNACRFSPDGTKYATGGADGKSFLYDGKTGELVSQLCEPAGRIHKGGVYGISWSPDSKRLMTCSADKTVKVWDLAEDNYKSNKEQHEFTLGNQVVDMQVGCVWTNKTLISVSLSGHLNLFNIDDPDAPPTIIKGHNKAIVSSCMNNDRTTFFTSSFDGVICYWDLVTGLAEVVGGKGHQTQITKMHCLNDTVATCSMDDTVRFISVADKKYTDVCVKLDSQPSGVAQGGLGMTVVTCANSIVVIQDGKVSHKYKSEDPPTCVDISEHHSKVAVGMEGNRVVIYDIEGDQLKESSSFPASGNVTDVKFSPDGKYLACCTGRTQVKIVLTSDFKTERANWGSHSGKVNTIAWTPDSKHLASCGIDGCVYTWDVERAERKAVIRGAHSISTDVTSVQWSDDTTLLTTGRQDCSARMWQITH